MAGRTPATKDTWLLLAAALPGLAGAAVIGHMAPAEPVTGARIAALPAAPLS